MGRDINILGVSMSNHDRSACIIQNGEVLVAISEERLDRRKKSEGFYQNNPKNIVIPPLASITYVLNEAGLLIEDLSLVVCGRSMKACKTDFLKYFPIDPNKVVEIPTPSHHLAHAYSAIGTSAFRNSAILVIDEQGHYEGESFERSSLYHYTNGSLNELKKNFGDKSNLSLGMFYDVFAAVLGLSEAGKPSAGKLMGLAPYGKQNQEWPELIDLKQGDTNISLKRLDEFFSDVLPIRKGMEEFNLEQIDDILTKYLTIHWDSSLAYDLAYKAQEELEKAVLYLSEYLYKNTNADYLCYAGGVALNCTTNGKLFNAGWNDIFVHPAATDDGNAIGLAIYGWTEVFGKEMVRKKLFNPFLGKKYSSCNILDSLCSYDLNDYIRKVDPVTTASEYLSSNKIICWFQGASEWGPRALGNRSIIANPLMKDVKNIINSRIKFRESFRPFGISGTKQGLNSLINNRNVAESLKPFMLAVGEYQDHRLKEIKHIDNSIRFQEINPSLQPLYHDLVENFGNNTGVYAIVNTSFNVIGEPLVESPDDAIRQFLISGADVLIIGNYLLDSNEIPKEIYEEKSKVAFNESCTDKLKFLLSLDYLGYYDKLDKFMSYDNFNQKEYLSQGPQTFRLFNELMLKNSIRKGNFYDSEKYAENILNWSSYSKESKTAVDYYLHYKDGLDRDIAYSISQILNQGSASRFFHKLLNN